MDSLIDLFCWQQDHDAETRYFMRSALVVAALAANGIQLARFVFRVWNHAKCLPRVETIRLKAGCSAAPKKVRSVRSFDSILPKRRPIGEQSQLEVE